MSVQKILRILVVCSALVSVPTAIVSTAFAGAQPGHGIAYYNIDSQIAQANRALRTAKRELRRALSRSRSLVRRAERTNDLQRKLRYLQQSVDILATTVQLRNQIEHLESTLQQLGVAQRVYENRQAEARRVVEEQARREIEAREEQLRLDLASQQREELSNVTPEVQQEAPALVDIENQKFISANPAIFNALTDKFEEEYAIAIVAELVSLATEYGAEAVFEVFKDAPLESADALIRLTELRNISSKVAATMLFDVIVEKSLTAVFGPDIDAKLISDIASDPASILVALAEGGNTSAISASVGLAFKTFKLANSAALSSYEEDQNFQKVTSSLIAADQLRLAADELLRSGKPEQSDKLRILANDIIASAVKNSEEVFSGVDGPVIAGLLTGIDNVIQIWRSGDQDSARLAFELLRAESEKSNGGITNDFYEQYFMLLRRPDTQRAFSQLSETMFEIMGVAN